MLVIRQLTDFMLVFRGGVLTLFAFGGLGWQGLLNPTVSLPPMDRGFIIFGIIWITWLWAFPEPSQAADAAALLLTLLVATAMGMSILTWQPQASQINYNNTIDDLIWQIVSLTFIVIGALILFIRKPDGLQFVNRQENSCQLVVGHAIRPETGDLW